MVRAVVRPAGSAELRLCTAKFIQLCDTKPTCQGSHDEIDFFIRDGMGKLRLRWADDLKRDCREKGVKGVPTCCVSRSTAAAESVSRRASSRSLRRALDGGHEVVQFFNSQHSNISNRSGEPGEGSRQFERRENASYRVDGFAAERLKPGDKDGPRRARQDQANRLPSSARRRT